MNNYRLSLLLILLGLTACAEQSTKSVELIPVEERNVPLEKAQPVIVKPEVIVDEKSTVMEKKKICCYFIT